jgi:hypothetical protein
MPDGTKMGRALRTYTGGVIALGAGVLVWSAIASPPALQWSSLFFVVLAIAASVVKFRLPGMEGTFSLIFLVLLYGVAHYPLTETLIAGCAGVIAQSCLNSKKRPTPIQVLFNAAHTAITIAICYLVGRDWLASAKAHDLPAVTAAVACTWFVVNTVLVSGVLSLLENKPLAEVCSQWYLWSFPCYLIGVILVGLLPAQGHVIPAQAFLILPPAVYLVHFFVRLAKGRDPSSGPAESPKSILPFAAQLYIMSVLTGGVMLVTLGAIYWESANLVRYFAWLALAMVAATLKIRLPRMTGTITPAFVLLLASIAQMSLPETVFMAAVVSTVQLVWRPARRPSTAQMLFNPACLVLSAALAWFVSRYLLSPWVGHSMTMVLVLSTVVLYGCNTLLVALVVALAENKPIGGIWQLCCFWSLPFYLVGAAAAGIMTAVSQSGDWLDSLLILPMTGLAYVSYRLQIRRSVMCHPAHPEAA